MKRLMLHKLEGEPAEVVRSVSKRHGLEQYRTLAQLCDPSAGGRNWADAWSMSVLAPGGLKITRQARKIVTLELLETS